MITPERLAMYKRLALRAVAARAKNPAAPGISCVNMSPHDALDLILHFEKSVEEDATCPACREADGG